VVVELSYAPNGQLAAEDGPWPNDTVSYAHDPAGRRTALTAQLTATYNWTQGYGWDGAGRLATATLPGSLAFAYAYTNAAGLAAAPARLVSRLALPTGAYLTNRHDAVARLLATELRNPSHAVLNGHGYLVNAAHQRTRHTRTDGNHVAFEYDPVGQLKKATGTGGSSPENLGYGYDAAWNLGVRTNGATAHPYTVNAKNELTAAEGATFHYDQNGNRLGRNAGGGYVTYTYDDENQLVGAETDTSATPEAYRWKVAFTYDGLGRLKVKQPYTWYPGSGWYAGTATRYVYDGRRVIQERTGGNTPVVAYGRGPDLSGTLEGAGGIGGLLSRSDQYQAGSGAFGRTVCYHADGGGNVAALMDTNHALLAQYRYDPYGRQTWSTGTLKDANAYRFSSKEFIPNLGFLHYGFRFYDPQTQRWLNRDPIEEYGGKNLYCFVRNQPTKLRDSYGLIADASLTDPDRCAELKRRISEL